MRCEHEVGIDQGHLRATALVDAQMGIARFRGLTPGARVSRKPTSLPASVRCTWRVPPECLAKSVGTPQKPPKGKWTPMRHWGPFAILGHSNTHSNLHFSLKILVLMTLFWGLVGPKTERFSRQRGGVLEGALEKWRSDDAGSAARDPRV